MEGEKMNLLTYTKKLSEQIARFDKLAKGDVLGNIYMANPFAKPINITIVWVDKNEKD